MPVTQAVPGLFAGVLLNEAESLQSFCTHRLELGEFGGTDDGGGHYSSIMATVIAQWNSAV